MNAFSQVTPQKEKHTIVFFSLEKTYDTVGREKILKSLQIMGTWGNFPKFVYNFLANWKFSVKIVPHNTQFINQLTLTLHENRE